MKAVADHHRQRVYSRPGQLVDTAGHHLPDGFGVHLAQRSSAPPEFGKGVTRYRCCIECGAHARGSLEGSSVTAQPPQRMRDTAATGQMCFMDKPFHPGAGFYPSMAKILFLAGQTQNGRVVVDPGQFPVVLENRGLVLDHEIGKVRSVERNESQR